VTNPYSMPQSELTEPVSNETYLPKLFSLSGRIGRVRYLAYGIGAGLLMLPLAVLLMGVGFLTGAAAGPDAAAGGGLLGVLLLYGLSFAITLVLARRRLNDMGKTGWLGLLMLVPLVNVIVGLWLLFGPGDAQANEYGPAPAPNTTGVLILAWVLPVIFVLGIIAAIAIPAYSGYTAKANAEQL